MVRLQDFLNHSDASECVPALNATIKMKPHFQSESDIFTKHWQGWDVNSVKCEVNVKVEPLVVISHCQLRVIALIGL